MSKSHSWKYLANLDHESQLDEFGWCACEEQEYFPYSNCPKESVGK